MLAALLGTIFGAVCQSFIETFLEEYLAIFGLSVTQIGVSFLGNSTRTCYQGIIAENVVHCQQNALIIVEFYKIVNLLIMVVIFRKATIKRTLILHLCII